MDGGIWWDLEGLSVVKIERMLEPGCHYNLESQTITFRQPKNSVAIEQCLLNLELQTSHIESQKHEKTHRLRTKPPSHFLKCHPSPPRPAPPGDSGRTAEL